MLTINNTLNSYLKDIEIIGNTIQDENNLADIRSVGEKVEGQELYEIPILSCGKNLFDKNKVIIGNLINVNNEINVNNSWFYTDYIKVKQGNYLLGSYRVPFDNYYCHFYNINKEHIGYGSSAGFSTDGSCTFTQEGYIRLSGMLSNIDKGQLEEGTVATEYEPYVEDKLTILSPTQLEKVGDVADRIICKDGVWGVEKNIGTVVPNGSENWRHHSTKENTSFFQLPISKTMYKLPINNNTKANILSNKFLNEVANIGYNNDVECIYLDTNTNLSVRILNTKLNTQDLVGFKTWLLENNLLVKYQLATPQFIPLPHDQQVKLRTFANKTNISFLTEIEGTVKAQVPKSLGATVNTHTTQIDNLNKELDRVKKLEENTVSTVITDKDFTVVEATSNGYFEDVKLEGKTLVNLAKNITHTIVGTEGNSWSKKIQLNRTLDVNKTYTLLFTVESYTLDKGYSIMGRETESIVQYSLTPMITKAGVHIYKFTTKININYLNIADEFNSTNGESVIKDFVLLEGDHTQNPPSYFEGLKSVGDDTDEIVVSSVNENLIPNIKFKKGGTDTPPYNTLTLDNAKYRSLGDFIFLPKGEYCINTNQSVSSQSIAFKVKDMFGNDIVGVTDTPFTFNNPISQYVYIFGRKGGGEWDLGEYPSDIGLTLTVGKDLNSYTPHQSDKKQLLFYNTETSTWEKPILREWDSIEKHSDGKYYYHQRSIEEDYVEGDESTTDYITDMTKTVKKLSTEKIYECTNIDLITYANETNYIVESGAITPISSLKVHNNIGNVVQNHMEMINYLEEKTLNLALDIQYLNPDAVNVLVDKLKEALTFAETKGQELVLLSNTMNAQETARQTAVNELVNEMEITATDIQDIMDMIGGLE